MWDVAACCVCLGTDARMYRLQSELERCYTDLVGETMRRPVLPYLCYECAALVHKCHEFRLRCQRGQAALCELYDTHHQLTLEEISRVDRAALRSSFGVHHIPASQFVEIQYAPEEVKVKEECVSSKVEPTVPEPEPQLLKVEKSDDEYNELSGYASVVFSSDEDEPLALRRSKIEAFIQQQLPDKKRRTKKKRKRGGEQEEVKERRKRRTPSPMPKVPKKRGPKPGSRRDDAELEEYVTIVKLTTEEQVREIEERRTSSNYLNAPFKCHVCFKGFVDTEAFKNHNMKHDPSAGDVECPICKFRFQTRRTLQKHAANHEKKYQCKSCPYISKTTTQAKQHQKWHKGITYKCQYCEEVLTKWTSYLSHVRIKHPSEHICNVCGYSFVSKLGLTMHKTMMHKEIQMPEKVEDSQPESAAAPYCAECDVQFTSRQAWKRHMVTSAKHSPNNDFGNGCRVCGESFPSAEELRLHHRKQHARRRPKNYGKKPSDINWPIRCQHCEEEIPNAREYWTHFRRVHPDKKYPIKKSFVCEICGKEFRGNAFLVYHKRTHSEERHYRCAQCPKSFFNRTNLQMHEKTHSEHRPYPCAVCFKAFKLKGALDRHFRSHTGVKPYECEFCGKAFGQSNSRKLHIRTVHLKQPAPYVSKSRLERRRQAETLKSQAPFAY